MLSSVLNSQRAIKGLAEVAISDDIAALEIQETRAVKRGDPVFYSVKSVSLSQI